MSAVKVTLIAMGFFSLLWLGSCALIGYGTVAVVETAADAAGRGVARVEGRLEEHVERAETEEWLEEDVTRNGATHFENHH
jgi:hypothetical protein